jgi:uncharacterized OsmC-like protein
MQWNMTTERAINSGQNFFAKSKQIIEIDLPSFLKGDGNMLEPTGDCVAGITSCFIAIFATVAAHASVRLTKLNVNAEFNMNFAKNI